MEELACHILKLLDIVKRGMTISKVVKNPNINVPKGAAFGDYICRSTM